MNAHKHCEFLMQAVLIMLLTLMVQSVHAQQAPARPEISLTVVEFKGSTTTEQLAPPPADPATLSKGYGYKAPGQVDKTAPQRWEVSSYAFTPGFITVHQGDTVTLNAFVVNGDHHEVLVTAPDGQTVAPTASWQRGRRYQVSFTADKPGTYRLTCATHAPTMTATILALPR
jgi:plastocyanin